MRSSILVLMLASPALAEGVFGRADVLYWQADSADFRNAASFSRRFSIEPDWSVGVRAGVGYQHCSGWKVSWTYTNFGAEDSRAWSSVRDPGDSFSSYSDLDFQLHDFEVGRSFCLTEYLEVEAFGGFRWGQVDYSVTDRYRVPPPPIMFIGGSYVRANSFTDSYGVRLGSEARCRLRGNLTLFGRVAVSGLVSTTHSDGMTQDLAISWWDATDNHENVVLDASTGLALQYGQLEFAAGYEWSSWQNSIQSRRIRYTDQADYEDLLLEGIFGRVSVCY
jgi:hypothetical protein